MTLEITQAKKESSDEKTKNVMINASVDFKIISDSPDPVYVDQNDINKN